MAYMCHTDTDLPPPLLLGMPKSTGCVKPGAAMLATGAKLFATSILSNVQSNPTGARTVQCVGAWRQSFWGAMCPS
eukprot:1721776-Amphidinium_carterae.2